MFLMRASNFKLPISSFHREWIHLELNAMHISSMILSVEERCEGLIALVTCDRLLKSIY